MRVIQMAHQLLPEVFSELSTRIKTLTFSGQATPVVLGNLTILVGPNNSGKSRALVDIHQLFDRRSSSSRVVVIDADIELPRTRNEAVQTTGFDFDPSSSPGKVNGLDGSPMAAGSCSSSHSWTSAIRSSLYSARLTSLARLGACSASNSRHAT